MVYKRVLLTVLVIVAKTVISGGVKAQNEEEDINNHHHSNEISLAIGIVPLVAEDKLTSGFHFHYIRGIGESNKFGLGAAIETILDEHKHYTFSVVFQYRVYEGLIFAYAPGLLMRKENTDILYQMAHHIETAYEFELGMFHLGPMAEIGIEKIGIHYMAGIHLGIDF